MFTHEQEIVFVIVGGTIILLFLAFVLIIYVVIFKKRQNRFINEKETMRVNYNQMLLRTQLEIQEQTLKNISQEIHDNIGQTLSLAKLNLNTLDMNDDESREQKLLNTKELVSKAITDLRGLSKTMNADSIVSAGLVKAIEYELGLIDKTGKIRTSMGVNGTVIRLDAHKELILFRIVQECLNNIIKHSEAKAVNVTMLFENNHLELKIVDDGKGFDPGISFNEMESGSGLRNMKSRTSVLGGTLDIHSDNGTQIRITIPINEQ